MTTFHALVIHLQAIEDASLPATQGDMAHAAFLALIDAVHPELAEAIHDHQGRKPFTLSPVWGLSQARNGRYSLKAGQRARLRLTLLDPALFHAFIHHLFNARIHGLRLGSAPFLITEVRGTPEGSPWAGYATVEELVQNAGVETRLSLQFASPTAIAVGRADSGKVRRKVLPIPRYVWASLRGGWRAFTGQQIPKEFEDWVERNVVASRIEKWQTAMFRFRKSMQVGGFGQIRYDALDDDLDMLRYWNLLADFAFYSGIGHKTSMGMGTSRRIVKDE